MLDYILVVLCLAAFVAGFVDAVVGGGGLIQTPLTIVLLPNIAVSQILGALKIPAFTGTSFAAYQYQKKVTIRWKPLLFMMVLTLLCSYLGATLLNYMNNNIMKPLLLVILVLLLLYTLIKKDFGMQIENSRTEKQKLVNSIIMSCILGFYEGFIGPGTGSFLVVGFITFLGYDFLNASANAKMVNLAGNLGSIILFVTKGKMLWHIALPMAVCNGLGGYCGAKFAIKKGNSFIRLFFIIVVTGTLIRFAYDVF
jgi:uncharacterized protein